MIPVLYAAGETAFTSEGLGRLSEAISCSVREVRNGEYELTMRYPVDGYLFSEIQHSRFIKAKPFDNGAPQPFEIYKISKPINGIVSVYGRHISYRLSYIPIMPFTANGIDEVFYQFEHYSAETNPFTFDYSVTGTGTYTQTVPSSIRNRLGGEQGSVLQTFGGEFEWNKWLVYLHNHRGHDNGVVISYGKNLIDLTQEESIENTYTGVAPYWEGETVVTLPEKVLHSAAAANYPYQRTIPLDMTADFIDQPTEAELRAAAQAYMERNNIGVPAVSLTVDFVPLAQTEDYKAVAPLEHVKLCDTVTVKFDKLGVSAKAKVIEARYDVLAEKYTQLRIGQPVNNLTDIIIDQSKSIDEVKDAEENDKTAWEQQLEHAIELITGGLGGHVVINTNEYGQPNEILIMDTDNIMTAQSILRMNMNGIAFTQSGYFDPNGWTSAWTIDGEFLAQNIVVRGLVANVIESGSFYGGNYQSTSGAEGFRINLDTGEIICPQLTISISNVSGLEDSLAEQSGNLGDLSDNVDDLSDQVAQNTAFRNDGRAFFRFDNDGVHVGRQGNEFETLTSNDRFAIVQNGREIAWFDSKGLDTSTVKLSDALLLPPLQLSNYDHGWIITKG